MASSPRIVPLAEAMGHCRKCEPVYFATQRCSTKLDAFQIRLVQDPTWEDVKSARHEPASLDMSPNLSNSSSEADLSPAGNDSTMRSPMKSSTPVKKRSGRKIKRRKARLLKASIKPIYKAETIAKKGYIHYQETSTNPQDGEITQEWKQVFAVLRRPYLSLYKDASQAEELPNVINISTVRVNCSEELDAVLEVSARNIKIEA